MIRVRRLLLQPEGPRAALTPVFSAAILTVTLAAAMAAWQSAPPLHAPATPAASHEVTPFTKWVKEDVAYIITEDERKAFKLLPTDAEREHFIEQFWLRRDPTPGTTENVFKQEHYRRIQYANDHYGTASIAGWKSDRGRIYIMYGPPDEKESHAARSGPNAAAASEQWLYHLIAGIGANVIVEFVDANATGEYRMSSDPSTHAPTTTADTPKAGATVQPMIPGGVLISVPLAPYGDHKVTVYGRVVGGKRNLQVFEDPIQGPAPLYTKIVRVPAGSYRLEIVVKDMTVLQLKSDSIEFEVK